MSDHTKQPIELSALTMTVSEAGTLLGLSRVASYEAVKRGEIPIYRFGPRMMKVPTAAFFQKYPGLKPTSES